MLLHSPEELSSSRTSVSEQFNKLYKSDPRLKAYVIDNIKGVSADGLMKQRDYLFTEYAQKLAQFKEYESFYLKKKDALDYRMVAKCRDLTSNKIVNDVLNWFEDEALTGFDDEEEEDDDDDDNSSDISGSSYESDDNGGDGGSDDDNQMQQSTSQSSVDTPRVSKDLFSMKKRKAHLDEDVPVPPRKRPREPEDDSEDEEDEPEYSSNFRRQ